jgi:hypothetical protein
MKDPQPRSRIRGSLVIAACAVPFLTMAYLLSIGPFAWLCKHSYLSVEIADRLFLVYGPVVWLVRRWPAFQDVMNWYIGLWGC